MYDSVMTAIHSLSASIAGEQTTPFERAEPFLITVAVLLVSIALVHAIIVRMEKLYNEGWTPEELAMVSAERAPTTYALTITWALDAAQLPALVAVPVTAIVALRHSYTWVFVLCYGATAATILLTVWFMRYVNIYQYTFRGAQVLGYGVTPIAIGGSFLNLLAAVREQGHSHARCPKLALASAVVNRPCTRRRFAASQATGSPAPRASQPPFRPEDDRETHGSPDATERETRCGAQTLHQRSS
jgi:hypothetical protein